MTYNVLMGTLNPTHSLTLDWSGVRRGPKIWGPLGLAAYDGDIADPLETRRSSKCFPVLSLVIRCHTVETYVWKSAGKWSPSRRTFQVTQGYWN